MTSVPSGTKDMGNFTHREICAIIKSCSDNGVKDFSWGDMKISFKHEGEHDFALPAQRPELPKIELTEEQKYELEFAKRQELMATNPVAYEQMIIDESEAGLYEGN